MTYNQGRNQVCFDRQDGDSLHNETLKESVNYVGTASGSNRKRGLGYRPRGRGRSSREGDSRDKHSAKCRIYSESHWLQATIEIIDYCSCHFISSLALLHVSRVSIFGKIRWYELNCRRGRPSKVRCYQAREVFPAGLYEC